MRSLKQKYTFVSNTATMCLIISNLKRSEKRYDFQVKKENGLFQDDEYYQMRIVLKEAFELTNSQIKKYVETVLRLKEESMLRENKNSFIFLLPINGSIFLLKERKKQPNPAV